MSRTETTVARSQPVAGGRTQNSTDLISDDRDVAIGLARELLRGQGGQHVVLTRALRLLRGEPALRILLGHPPGLLLDALLSQFLDESTFFDLGHQAGLLFELPLALEGGLGVGLALRLCAALDLGTTLGLGPRAAFVFGADRLGSALRLGTGRRLRQDVSLRPGTPPRPWRLPASAAKRSASARRAASARRSASARCSASALAAASAASRSACASALRFGHAVDLQLTAGFRLDCSRFGLGCAALGFGGGASGLLKTLRLLTFGVGLTLRLGSFGFKTLGFEPGGLGRTQVFRRHRIRQLLRFRADLRADLGTDLRTGRTPRLLGLKFRTIASSAASLTMVACTTRGLLPASVMGRSIFTPTKKSRAKKTCRPSDQ